MLPYFLAAGFGAWFVGRTKPKTRVEKKVALGPVSGINYKVEDFPQAGFLVVKAPGGSMGVFTRGPNGLTLQRAKGDPGALRTMVSDFSRPPPTSVPNEKKESA